MTGGDIFHWNEKQVKDKRRTHALTNIYMYVYMPPSMQRGKPTLTRPREYLILERRKQEELREEANAMVNYNKQFDLKVVVMCG